MIVIRRGAEDRRPNGIPQGAPTKTSGPDLIRAMSTLQWLEFLGISLDSERATERDFVINLVTPDNGEEFVVELSNATLTVLDGFSAADPDLTITIDREDLVQTMMGVFTFDEQISSGNAAS